MCRHQRAGMWRRRHVDRRECKRVDGGIWSRAACSAEIGLVGGDVERKGPLVILRTVQRYRGYIYIAGARLIAERTVAHSAGTELIPMQFQPEHAEIVLQSVRSARQS